ncbi:hypothetical protein G7Y79_00016g040820 [Physcia stellaris]|nr:hypothetical protein G7Y79_00016g040820 [Physcia stellaris]
MLVATAEDECNTDFKKSAAEREKTRKIKKAKLEKTKDFGCEVFGPSCDIEAGLGGEDGCLDRDRDGQEIQEISEKYIRAGARHNEALLEESCEENAIRNLQTEFSNPGF